VTLRARAATVEDAPALAALAALTFPLACPPGTDPADAAAFVRAHLTAARLAAHAADASCDLLLVEDPATPGTPLAYALVLDDAPPVGTDVAAPSRKVSKLYAHPDVHGTPVAPTLMAAVLAAARARGAAAAWLGVNARNTRAQRFYAKHGFEVVGTTTTRVGALTHDDLVLARHL